jgi:mannose-6-phosphate isomerase-like protein (cupin superfamily)
MKIKLTHHHKIVETTTCGPIREILSLGEYPAFDLAMAIDLQPTKAHFHQTFDEIYLVIDGTITLKLFNPATEKHEEFELISNELCIITKGIHHQIIQSSKVNRLCVISSPRWVAEDEHLSSAILT